MGGHGQNVAGCYGMARLHDLDAVQPDVAFGHQPGGQGAGLDDPREPQPLVETLAGFGQGWTSATPGKLCPESAEHGERRIGIDRFFRTGLAVFTGKWVVLPPVVPPHLALVAVRRAGAFGALGGVGGRFGGGGLGFGFGGGPAVRGFGLLGPVPERPGILRPPDLDFDVFGGLDR